MRNFNEIQELINESLKKIQDSNKFDAFEAFEAFDWRYSESKQLILLQHDFVTSLKYDEDFCLEVEYSTSYYQYDMSNFTKESLTDFLSKIINSLES